MWSVATSVKNAKNDSTAVCFKGNGPLLLFIGIIPGFALPFLKEGGKGVRSPIATQKTPASSRTQGFSSFTHFDDLALLAALDVLDLLAGQLFGTHAAPSRLSQ